MWRHVVLCCVAWAAVRYSLHDVVLRDEGNRGVVRKVLFAMLHVPFYEELRLVCGTLVYEDVKAAATDASILYGNGTYPSAVERFVASAAKENPVLGRAAFILAHDDGVETTTIMNTTRFASCRLVVTQAKKDESLEVLALHPSSTALVLPTAAVEAFLAAPQEENTDCSFDPEHDDIFLEMEEVPVPPIEQAMFLQMQPFFMVAGTAIGPMVGSLVGAAMKGETMNRVLEELEKDSIEEVLHSLPNQIIKVLLPNLVKVMSTTFPQKASDEAATAITEQLVPKLVHDIQSDMVKTLKAEYVTGVAKEIALTTTEKLLRDTAPLVMKCVSHSTAAVLAHTLGHAPIVDVFCTLCSLQGSLCDSCKSVPHQLKRVYDYAGFYSNHFSSHRLKTLLYLVHTQLQESVSSRHARREFLREYEIL